MDPIDEIVQLAKALIAIPSTSADLPSLHTIVDYIDNFVKKSGLSTRKLEYSGKPSLLITLNDKLPVILLNGHADVVPAKPQQFSPVVKEGKLYGRGAEDMKGQLAVLIYIMTNLSKDSPVQLLINTDEEVGGHLGAKTYAETLKVKPKFVLVGEATDFKIENTSKGVTQLKLTALGRRAHSAYPWNGDNAITKLVDELNNVIKFYPRPSEWIWETTCNIGRIEGGEATNQVPDAAVASLDIRRIPSETTAQILKRLTSALVYPDSKYEVMKDEAAHFTAPEGIYFEKLSQSVKSVFGSPAVLMQQCGASDARHFSAVGIPAVCFGPPGHGLHSDEEFIEISQLGKYYKTLLDFFQRI